MDDTWKNHIVDVNVTVRYTDFDITKRVLVKNLPEDFQKEYYQYLISEVEKQKEIEGRFIYVSNQSKAITHDDILAWNEYFKYYQGDKTPVNPSIEEWRWKSSKGEISLKDMYYVNKFGKILGAIFFALNEKYEIACLIIGTHLSKVSRDSNLHQEFNKQLASFNYVRKTKNL